ncbi:DMT family transporter [Ectothiorhodospiraceae bacterium 2226]|nr:DMT family transporter [Ectothiorhodospiraceae bacterium 2226]
MQIPAAYLAVVVIWSTTPLAIQWSAAESDFLFAVTARMVLGALVCLALMGALSVPLPWHRAARRTYAAAGLGIYGAMLCVYWAAQHIPSGLISVLFGLAPLVTGVLAVLWLNERALTPPKLVGMALGLGGLALVFGAHHQLGPFALWGILAMLASVLVHAASTVWVKRIDAPISAFAVTGGGLLLAAPLFALTWLASGAAWPAALPNRAAWSIVYLALAGSVLGFVLFYFLLQRLESGRVAVIALLTPVLALLLGRLANDEPVQLQVWSGALLIVGGLALHFWGRAPRGAVTPQGAQREGAG